MAKRGPGGVLSQAVRLEHAHKAWLTHPSKSWNLVVCSSPFRRTSSCAAATALSNQATSCRGCNTDACSARCTRGLSCCNVSGSSGPASTSSAVRSSSNEPSASRRSASAAARAAALAAAAAAVPVAPAAEALVAPAAEACPSAALLACSTNLSRSTVAGEGSSRRMVQHALPSLHYGNVAWTKHPQNHLACPTPHLAWHARPAGPHCQSAAHPHPTAAPAGRPFEWRWSDHTRTASAQRKCCKLACPPRCIDAPPVGLRRPTRGCPERLSHPQPPCGSVDGAGTRQARCLHRFSSRLAESC